MDDLRIKVDGNSGDVPDNTVLLGFGAKPVSPSIAKEMSSSIAALSASVSGLVSTVQQAHESVRDLAHALDLVEKMLQRVNYAAFWTIYGELGIDAAIDSMKTLVSSIESNSRSLRTQCAGISLAVVNQPFAITVTQHFTDAIASIITRWSVLTERISGNSDLEMARLLHMSMEKRHAETMKLLENLTSIVATQNKAIASSQEQAQRHEAGMVAIAQHLGSMGEKLSGIKSANNFLALQRSLEVLGLSQGR